LPTRNKKLFFFALPVKEILPDILIRSPTTPYKEEKSLKYLKKKRERK
jgi:hypothetical protein